MGQTRKPVAGDIYRHFKNRLYEIITIAIHSETEEEMVVYRQMYGNLETYVRPLSMFLSEVDHEKYPEVKQKYRFQRVGSMNLEDEPEEENAKEDTEEKIDTVSIKVQKEVVSAEVEEREKVSVQSQTIRGTAETLSEPEIVMEEVTVSKESAGRTEENVELDESTRILMDFLDARTYGEKLRVLEGVRCELSDRILNSMAISMDLVIEEGSLEERLLELKECIRTKAKYECFRLN